MAGLTLEGSTVVALHRLHIGEEHNGESEVGRPETGTFIALPAEGVALVRWLADEVPLRQVGERFMAAYGQEVDVVGFVRELSGCGFINSINGCPLVDESPAEIASEMAAEPRGWRLLSGLPQSRVAWLLSRPARACYFAIWATVLALLVTRPDLRPSADGALLNIGVLGNLAVLTGLGWLLVFLHELAHLVAVRARGCSGSLDLSHRLHLLVAQTDMTSVRVLPRNERYAPYLAGMTWDATVLLSCLLLRAAGLASDLPQVIAYLLAMSLLFELGLFLRTDVYYVVTNLLRLGNLMYDTRRWLTNVTLRIVRAAPRHDLSDIPPRELRMVRWFAILVIVGVGVTIGQFVLLGLPLLLTFVRDSANGLYAGPGSLSFWDSAGLLAVVATQFGLLFIAVVRERRRAQARAARAAAGLALIENA
jgi:hypothetical protein